MKKIFIFVLCYLFLIINYTLADTKTEERKFILYIKLPLTPKIPVMELDTTLLFKKSNKYELTFEVKTLNLVNFISSINGNGFVKGSIINSAYSTDYYKYDYKRNSKEKSILIEYLDKKIAREAAAPSFDKSKLTPVTSNQKDGTIDPATLFLNLLKFDKINHCKGSLRVYDGKRRYDIVFEKKEIKNNQIVCFATQNKIGGYKKNKVSPLTKADFIKIIYKNSPNTEFIEFQAKNGFINLTIVEVRGYKD